MSLPCATCPHTRAGVDHCCLYGASLTFAETNSIRALHGTNAVVWSDEEGGYRTNTNERGCVLLREGSCTIHGQSYYPEVCGRFPVDAGSTDICPELR
jgi:hypothetical protein